MAIPLTAIIPSLATILLTAAVAQAETPTLQGRYDPNTSWEAVQSGDFLPNEGNEVALTRDGAVDFVGRDGTLLGSAPLDFSRASGKVGIATAVANPDSDLDRWAIASNDGHVSVYEGFDEVADLNVGSEVTSNIASDSTGKILVSGERDTAGLKLFDKDFNFLWGSTPVEGTVYGYNSVFFSPDNSVFGDYNGYLDNFSGSDGSLESSMNVSGLMVSSKPTRVNLNSTDYLIFGEVSRANVFKFNPEDNSHEVVFDDDSETSHRPHVYSDSNGNQFVARVVGGTIHRVNLATLVDSPINTGYSSFTIRSLGGGTVVGDFDGDGTSELGVGQSNNYRFFNLESGDEVSWSPLTVANFPNNVFPEHATDLDGDGISEFVGSAGVDLLIYGIEKSSNPKPSAPVIEVKDAPQTDVTAVDLFITEPSVDSDLKEYQVFTDFGSGFELDTIVAPDVDSVRIAVPDHRVTYNFRVDAVDSTGQSTSSVSYPGFSLGEGGVGDLVGDANGDYKLNIFDVLTVLKVLGGNESDPLVMARSDVDQNGKVNIFDVLALLKLLSA